MSFLPAIADGIRCIAMPEGTLLVFPYSVRRQTLKWVKVVFFLLFYKICFQPLHRQLFSQLLCTLKAQVTAGLE